MIMQYSFDKNEKKNKQYNNDYDKRNRHNCKQTDYECY